MPMIKKTNIPNYLTYGRILSIIIIVALILLEGDIWRWLALIFYIIAAISDFFDGYLARKWNVTSPIGQMLDPIADKLLVGALLLLFAFDGTFSNLDIIAAIIIMLREIFISGLREYLGNKNIVLKVSMLAKYKTTIQMIALGFLFAKPMLIWVASFSTILLWLAAILTIITGWQYWLGAKRALAVSDKGN